MNDKETAKALMLKWRDAMEANEPFERIKREINEEFEKGRNWRRGK